MYHRRAETNQGLSLALDVNRLLQVKKIWLNFHRQFLLMFSKFDRHIYWSVCYQIVDDLTNVEVTVQSEADDIELPIVDESVQMDILILAF